MLANLVRDLFWTIDVKVIYPIVSIIFQLIIDLSKFELFSPDAVKSFSNRIYLILGIVMVFKLMISFIQMLINPDNMNDKENGFGGILRRVTISMILIVIVPDIFTGALKLQEQLLPVIPKVILATPVDGSTVEETGKFMAYQTFVAFFHPHVGCEGQSHLSITGKESGATIGSIDGITNEEVKLKGCSSEAATSDNGYVYEYQIFVSTIVGAFLIYVLVTIALKIAIRAIKFSLCRIIAPIPIASYIDPKTSKQSFDKWVETTIKVYLDLFTRLAVVYFIIYVFRLLFVDKNASGLTNFQTVLGNTYTGNGGTVRGLLVMVFIIMGLLYFAKEMPKFVTNMLGISDGFSDIGDMFKGQGWRALGTTLGGAAGLATQPVSSAITNYRMARKMGEGRGTALRRAFNTGVGGVVRSGRAFVNNEGFAGAYTKAHQTSMSNLVRRVNIANDKRRERDERKTRSQARDTLRANYADTYGGNFDDAYHDYEDNQRVIRREQANVNTYENQINELQKQLAVYNAQGKTESANEVMEKIRRIEDRKNNSKINISNASRKIEDFRNDVGNIYGGTDTTAYKELWGNFTRDIQHAPGTISGAASNAWNTFVGNPVPTSRDYSTGKSLMDSGTSIFKSFADTIDIEPSKVTGTFTEKVNGKVLNKISYSSFMDKYSEAMRTGQAVQLELEDIKYQKDASGNYVLDSSGNKIVEYKKDASGNYVLDANGNKIEEHEIKNFTAAEMQELHKRMQKKATIQYANDVYSGVVSDQKRKDMMDEYVVNLNRQLNLSQTDMMNIQSEMQASMGKFLADADDKAKKFARTSTDMQGREQLKQESKNGSGGH